MANLLILNETYQAKSMMQRNLSCPRKIRLNPSGRPRWLDDWKVLELPKIGLEKCVVFLTENSVLLNQDAKAIVDCRITCLRR